jgi:hypothetical protein
MPLLFLLLTCSAYGVVWKIAAVEGPRANVPR